MVALPDNGRDLLVVRSRASLRRNAAAADADQVLLQSQLSKSKEEQIDELNTFDRRADELPARPTKANNHQH